MNYFFTFFRIFRFEHSKVTTFFKDYDLLDFEALPTLFYNQNYNIQTENQYHNVHSNHNFKFLFIAGYFALMPIVMTVDFFIIQCTST